MTDHKLRCGDTVRPKSKPDLQYIVAYADYERDCVAFMGWPFGTCRISDVELIKACSDEEHKTDVSWLLDNGGRDEGCDDCRQTAHRLYRPRSYWAGIVWRREDELRAASEALAHARQRLFEAQQGSEDA